MNFLCFTLIALVSLFLWHTGEVMMGRPPPQWWSLIAAHETATDQCNGITRGTPAMIQAAAADTCRQAFVQLDMAAMNTCTGWEKAMCRPVPGPLGQELYECTIKMPRCWNNPFTGTRSRTLLECTYRTIAETINRRDRKRSRRNTDGASGSGYAGASGSGYAAASGSGYAGASGSGYAAASGSGYADASGSGYAGASGSGYAGASGSSRSSPPPRFQIPSISPTPQNPSIPDDPTRLRDPDFTTDVFSYQDPTNGRGTTPRYPSAPAPSMFGGGSFSIPSLPPTPQQYSPPADPTFLRDDTFGVDEVPYDTPLFDANPAEQLPPAGTQRKGKRKVSSSDIGATLRCKEPACANTSFDTRKQFMDHLRYHRKKREEVKPTCPQCGLSFPSLQAVTYHQNKEHNPLAAPKQPDQSKSYVCPYDQCDRRYSTDYSLQQHLKSHMGKADCPYCKKPYLNPSAMYYHVRRHHPDKPSPSSRPRKY